MESKAVTQNPLHEITKLHNHGSDRLLTQDPKSNSIQQKRQGMDLPSAAIGALPQSIASDIRGDWVVEKRKMNMTFLRTNFSPRCFDRMLTYMPELGALGARGEGQKPTAMAQHCSIEAGSKC